MKYHSVSKIPFKGKGQAEELSNLLKRLKQKNIIRKLDCESEKEARVYCVLLRDKGCLPSRRNKTEVYFEW